MNRDVLGVLVTTPPQAIESEQQVIGCMIQGFAAEGLALVADDKMFWSDEYRAIFRAIASLCDRGAPVDAVTVRQEDKECDALALMNCAEVIPSRANLDYHCGKMREAHQRRVMLEVGLYLAQEARNAESPDEAIAKAAQRVTAIPSAKRGPSDMRALLADVFKGINAKCVRETIPTGFYGIDDLLGGGLARGELVIVGARPATGKTTFALNVGGNVAKSGQSVLLVSLEMTLVQLGLKMMQWCSGLTERVMMSASETEMQRVRDAAARMSEWDLRIYDPPGTTLAELLGSIRQEHRQKPLDLIVIDYLQLIVCPPRERRDIEVGVLSRSLKQVARECNCPVMALCQLNRQSEMREDRKPRVNDLRESGNLEQDADVVILMHKDEQPMGQNATESVEFHVAKNRNGVTGICDLGFLGYLSQFQNRATRRQEQEGVVR
ncbi:MAG: DnaB-like helicase C-terminal domain-containing protein [bacterium]